MDNHGRLDRAAAAYQHALYGLKSVPIRVIRDENVYVLSAMETS